MTRGRPRTNPESPSTAATTPSPTTAAPVPTSPLAVSPAMPRPARTLAVQWRIKEIAGEGTDGWTVFLRLESSHWCRRSHGLVLDPDPPTIQFSGTLGALQATFLACDDGELSVLVIAESTDVVLVLAGVEDERMDDLDELELLGLGVLGAEAKGLEEVEDRFLTDLGDGGNGGWRFPDGGGECGQVLHWIPAMAPRLHYQ